MAIFRYIIETIICSGLFLVAYRWILAKKVSFSLCRAFIVMSMLLAVVIPAMNVPLFPEKALERQTILTGFDLFVMEPDGAELSDQAVEMKASENMAAETFPASKPFDIKAAATIRVCTCGS